MSTPGKHDEQWPQIVAAALSYYEFFSQGDTNAFKTGIYLFSRGYHEWLAGRLLSQHGSAVATLR